MFSEVLAVATSAIQLASELLIGRREAEAWLSLMSHRADPETKMQIDGMKRVKRETRQRWLWAGQLTHRTPCAPQGASERSVFPPHT